MRNLFLVSITFSVSMFLAACDESAVPAPAPGPSDPSVPQEAVHKTDRDRCLISKPRFLPLYQCIIASLKGFDVDGEHQDGDIGFMACRPVEQATLDTNIFLGHYDVVSPGYNGTLSNMATVGVHVQGHSLIDEDQEGRIGTVKISEIDVGKQRVINGDIEIETGVGSRSSIRRKFSAAFRGFYLDTPHFADPDREGVAP